MRGVIENRVTTKTNNKEKQTYRQTQTKPIIYKSLKKSDHLIYPKLNPVQISKSYSVHKKDLGVV